MRPSPMQGIYEVTMGADIAYVSADGRYLINGDLYEVDSRKNLTEARRVEVRSKALAKLDERDMIMFSPAPAKHTITVFTDVECGYCRKLHSEIDELNKLGVRVRYVAYPRAGPGTEDWAEDGSGVVFEGSQGAITQAKQGEEVKAPNCGATPVAKQYAAGRGARRARHTRDLSRPTATTSAAICRPRELVSSWTSSRQRQQQIDVLNASTE